MSIIKPELHLGVLCRRGHNHEGTDQSLRDRSGHCVLCDQFRKQARRSMPGVRERDNLKAVERRRKKPELYRAILKRFREGHKQEIRQQDKARYYANHDHVLATARARRERIRESIRASDRESKLKYRREHPEEARQYGNAYYKRKHILIKLRVRLRRAFRDFSTHGKTKHADEYGIDYQAILAHLGPCPGNPNDWHIDHIRPLSSFDWDDPEQIKLAFAPENHQWLSASENLRKHTNYAQNC